MSRFMLLGSGSLRGSRGSRITYSEPTLLYDGTKDAAIKLSLGSDGNFHITPTLKNLTFDLFTINVTGNAVLCTEAFTIELSGGDEETPASGTHTSGGTRITITAKEAGSTLNGYTIEFYDLMPASLLFWTTAVSGATTLKLTTTTDDEKSVIIYWGDGSFTFAPSGTEVSHSYTSADTFIISTDKPENILTLQNADETCAVNGSVDTQYLTNLTSLKIRKAGITEASLVYSTALEVLELNDNGLTTIDLYANVLLDTVKLQNNSLSAEAIDGVLEDLDATDIEDGAFDYSGNTGSAWIDRSDYGQLWQLSLEAKGWTITLAAPTTLLLTVTNEDPISITFNITTNDDSDYYIYWGDESLNKILSEARASHTYSTGGTYHIRAYNTSKFTWFVSDMDDGRTNGILYASAMPNVTNIELFSSMLANVVFGDTNVVDWITIQENSISAANLDAIILKLDGSSIEDGNFSFHSQADDTHLWHERSIAARTALDSLATKGWTVNPGNPVEFWSGIECPEPPVFWECQPNAGAQFSLAITTTDPSPTIDWGDGTVESYTSGVAKTHTYATADGTNKYKIRIYRPELVTKIVDADSNGFRRGTLTLTQFPELVEIRIRRSNCSGTLDLSANVKLETAYFTNNAFSGTLDLSANVKLATANFAINAFSGTLDLSANVKMEYAYFYNNAFSGTLDLSANVKLVNANFAINAFSGTLDLSANVKMVNANFNDNSFTSINITGCTNLVTFYAYSNSGLTTITGAAALGQAAGTHNIRVYSCSITAATIDAILAACVAGGRTGGYLDYKAQTGNGHLDGNRSAQGLLDIATLEGRTPAWSVVRA